MITPALRKLALFLVLGQAFAKVCEKDAGDYACIPCDASDNAIIADYKDAPFASNLATALKSTKEYSGAGKAYLSHETFSAHANDTSVLVTNNKFELHASYVDIVKTGYSSDLIQASFFGVNAAINAQNASKVYLDHMNITTHNGAANVYSYGTDTVVYISDSSLYSSGPVAHGLYSSGNGTIYGTNLQVYTGGNRCSAFSGDSPVGYIHVTNAVAHTAGIGSAIFYALGDMYGTDVVGIAERSPSMFMDGIQHATYKNVDFTAGLLAGVCLFGSRVKQAGGTVSFKDSRLSLTGADMPALWFGNTIASISLYNTEINTLSGVLVVANYSQITQDFDYFAGYADNSGLAPADGTVTVEESHLVGDLVAYNGSTISWSLAAYSTWTGAAYIGYGTGSFGVYIDKTSKWTLTKDTTLLNFTDADTTFSNIASHGHNIYYVKSSKPNAYLKGKTYKLPGGGKVMPVSSYH